MKREKSKELFERAQKALAGGVSSGARANIAAQPLIIEYGKGSKIYDVDGNEYIDCILAWGPLILGHAHPRIIQAVKESLEKSWLYACTIEPEIQLAEKIKKHVPCAELVRFSCSGTESIMAAVRVARAYTGRSKIIKFEGCYHGGCDNVLVNTHTPALGTEISPIKIPDSAGIPEESYRNTIVTPWNNIDILKKTVKKYRSEIAAILCNPYPNCMTPEDGFLKAIRELTEEQSILLIFDEVITGFRLALGGAQEYFGVIPDIAVFAKAMGGGFPISAIAGKQNIMELIGNGKSFHGGTMNANRPAVVAALATLRELEASDGAAYRHLRDMSSRLIEGLNTFFDELNIDAVAQGYSQWQVFFTSLEKVRNYRERLTVLKQVEKYITFQKELLDGGVLISPKGGYAFISAVHSRDDIEKILSVAENALKKLDK